MGRPPRGKARTEWHRPFPGTTSRLYSPATDGKEKGEGHGDERDAVRGFLHQKKLPTTARRRAFYSDGSGLPLDADAPELRSPATPVAATFNRLLKACCDIDQEKYLRQQRMKEAWPSLVGPELAEKLAFEKFDAGILYAFARNSVELFEIRQFKLRALEAKARRLPAFKGLRQIRLKCR